ncbi:hypothetical protein [Sphingomonas cavernae]|uniref:Phage holin family protein n=1 Tax=Sphingomonas cavernae TaxID=2320861 RepID=A0A418WP32_9SPHN|nr:hypothetical protein [Sphingomonas cavernae]RJF92979.1 hypothetical protein D3876_00900 [Sphingomonas cavernae]
MTVQELIDAGINLAGAVIAAIGPAAMGSAVAQAWKPGLSWRQRIVQWVVGICVSYFVTRALGVWLGWHEFVSQAMGFVIGMVAFEVAPRFVKAAGDTAAQLPDAIKDYFLKRKGPSA